MFNRDALFGKKDDAPRNEPRSSVNVTPGLGGANPPMRPHPAAEPAKPDLRFAEVSKQPQQPQARPDEPPGSRLIVGPDIKLKGVEITDCDTLVVEGRVEASMDSRVIQIAENGVFSGTVSIDVAEIRGRFEGSLTARKQLVIYSSGRVSGQIRYGKIRIEEGGELSGEISTLAREVPLEVPAPAATASAPAANPPSTAPAIPAAAAPAANAAATAQVARAASPASPAPREAPTSSAAAATRNDISRSPRPAGKNHGAGVNTV